MSKIILEYLGVEGTGRTVKEAKLDATHTIERMLKVDRSPYFMAFRGQSVLIWHNGNNYVSRILDTNEDYSRGKKISYCTSHCSDSIAEVLAHNRQHLAQLCWDGIEEMSPLLTEEKEQRKFAQWVRFQRAYQEASRNGLSEMDCHRYACEHSYA
jgi:hypothetical protein